MRERERDQLNFFLYISVKISIELDSGDLFVILNLASDNFFHLVCHSNREEVSARWFEFFRAALISCNYCVFRSECLHYLSNFHLCFCQKSIITDLSVEINEISLHFLNLFNPVMFSSIEICSNNCTLMFYNAH